VKGRAVPAAYTDTGADLIACPHCAAGIGEPCVKSDGRVSRAPCCARLAGAVAPAGVPPIFSIPDDPDKGRISDADLGRISDRTDAAGVDFSEPRRHPAAIPIGSPHQKGTPSA